MHPTCSTREVSRGRLYGDFPPLVITCTDRENGGWFRNTAQTANFWGGFYQPLLDRVRTDQSAGIRPIFIDEYLRGHGVYGEVSVDSGARKTGWHDGPGFGAWKA